LRLILNEFRRLIEMDQWVYFIPQFCQTIREAYFDAAILAGVLTVPDYATSREDVVDTLWVPQGWPYSHPVQDVRADKDAISGGLQSLSATILSNGDDPEEVFNQIAADKRRLAELGLVFDTDPKNANPPTPADPALLDTNQ
jgi:capsid protein